MVGMEHAVEAAPVTYRKGVTPGLLFRRPAPKVAALVHCARLAAD